MAIDYDKHVQALYGTGESPSSGEGPAGGSRYDRIIEQQERERASRLKLADQRTRGVSPDTAADDVRLAEQAGVPRDTASRNRDRLTEALKPAERDYGAVIRRYQGLSRWLEESEDNVAISRDDLPTLMKLEDALRRPEELTRWEKADGLEWIAGAVPEAYTQGQQQDELGRLRWRQMTGQATAEELERADQLSQQMQSRPDLAADGFFSRGVVEAARSLPTMFGATARGVEYGASGAAAGAAGGAMAGNLTGVGLFLPEEVVTAPAGALAGGRVGFASGTASYFGETEAGLAFDEFRGIRNEAGEPLDEDTARVAAASVGAVNGLLETAGFGAIVRSIPGGEQLMQGGARAVVRRALRRPSVRTALGNVARRYGGAMAGEGVTEAAQEATTIIAGELAKMAGDGEFEDVEIAEAMRRVTDAGVAGASAAAVLGAPGSIAGLGVDARRAQQANRNVRVFEAMGEAAGESRLRQRLPERFRGAVERMREDGPVENVYVDVERWNELYQSEDVNPRDVAAEVMGDGGRAYDEASRSNADLVIPIEAYAEKIAGSEYHARLTPDLRFRADDMSQREAEQWQADWQQALQGEPDSEGSSAFETIKQDIVGQLLATGMRQQDAEASAAPVASFITTQAEREGLDPIELYRSRSIEARRPMPEVLKTRGGTTDTSLDPMLDRLRAGDLPRQEDAFGESLVSMLRRQGLNDEGGELAARDVDAELKPFQRRLIRNDDPDAMTLDDAARMAWENQYIASPEGGDVRPTPDDLLAAIDQELRGEPVYRADAGDSRQAEELRLLEELDEYLGQLGLNLSELSNEEVRAALDEQARAEAEPVADLFDGSAIAGSGANRGTFDPADERILYQDDRITDVTGIKVEELSDDELAEAQRYFDRLAAGQSAVAPDGSAGRTVAGDRPDESWSAQTAIRAAGGGPALVHRGAQRGLDPADFDVSALGQNTGLAPSGLGVWFTTDAEDAAGYGPHVETFQLDVRSPRVFTVDDPFPEFDTVADATAYREQLRADGYDGVVIDVRDIGGPMHVIAFDPGQAIRPEGLGDRQLEQRASDKRGSIRFERGGERRTFRIDLFEKANLSTFLHESGHYFLEVMADLAERPDASESIRADWQRTLEFLGVDSREAIGTEQHEQWARAVEAYFREGTAPSEELRGAFAKFRSWLVALYRQLRQLDVELTDEVRGVMDRLLATDEQIRAAHEALNYRPLPDEVLTDAADADRQAYRDQVAQAREEAESDLSARAMAELQREQKQWWREAEEAMREAVRDEVYAQPAYRALYFLQRGRLPDGQETDAPAKLNKQALVDLYGEPFLKRLPGPMNPDHKGAYVYSRQGGAHPDAVAPMFGFGSGDELVQALVNLRPAREVIDAEVGVRMREEYGDMLLDGSMPEAAIDAVHSTQRANLMNRELQILNRRRGARGVSPGQELRRLAQETIREKAIRELRPDVYRRAEAKAARAAFEAATAGDYDRAYLEKQRQLYNHHLYRAARDARDQAEKHRAFALKFRRKARRERLAKAGEDYLNQVDAILADHELANVSARRIQRRLSLREWLAAREAEVQPIERPDYVTADAGEAAARQAEEAADSRAASMTALMSEAGTRNWRELTPEQLAGVRDNLAMIWHLAKLKTDLLDAQDQRSLAEAAAELSSSITENANRVTEASRQPELRWNKAKDSAADFLARSRRLPSFAREMDGGRSGGAMWRHIIRPLNRATNDYSERLKDHGDRLAAIYDAHYSAREQSDMLRTPRYYAPIDTSLTKDGVLAIALNWGNETNRERLELGEGWSRSQVEAVLDTLDARDWQFVQDVWDHVDSYWPEFRENHKAMYGIPPEKVDPAPVYTRHGTFRGGYYPIAFDPTRNTRTREREMQQEGQRFDRPGNRREAGSAKSRVTGPVRMPLQLSVMAVVNRHVSDVIHHVAYDRPLYDAARLLAQDDVKAAITEHYGRQVYDRFNRLLTDIKWGTAPPDGAFERTINSARNGASVAAMGFSITTAMLQPLGLSNSIVQIGPSWVLKGLARVGSSAASMENAARYALDRSAFMRLRRQNTSREQGDLLNRLRGKGWRSKLDAASFWLTANLQFAAVDLPTWYGALEKARAAGMDEADAVDIADQAVRDAQGGGDLIDQTEFQRGGTFAKMFTNFMSYLSTTYSIQAERYRTNPLEAFSDYVRLASDHLLLAVLPAVGSVLLDSMREGLVGGEDEDDFAQRVGLELAGMYMGSFVGVRELSGAVQGYYNYSGPAGLSVFGEASGVIAQAAQGDADKAFVRSVTGTAGVIFHLPATQIDRAIFGTQALIEGETDNPAAVLFGPPRN